MAFDVEPIFSSISDLLVNLFTMLKELLVGFAPNMGTLVLFVSAFVLAFVLDHFVFRSENRILTVSIVGGILFVLLTAL